ncbi:MULTISPECIES: M3 family oligoendopeptidase [unclassified Breznakia]|uniref:M3 family oligoendopeptidase n=1 Tax=unclassified Breznakia TaxID=2623764 RepID=UPI002475AE93|nr:MULTISPECIES: M3 family oligoendopeptidase [unclassified Breznakia]MDH6367575.1 M3 family oligoendopeptidase [Breznakia sp. PH1-1]MDH6404695.1 M3 family oligoendopeptidase [Breznakia sp. PF1-11]MDH6412405.1 M3 family oligoendopeptidase [Breznakia sp. PFB1-11]MDH6414770.1 M3 family oligoendopeptidase [Breznakia sp. PFB1-14]MDH6417076.1 M3 family oligoendopeptidase [Breznakia sp. PFB1-4]
MKFKDYKYERTNFDTLKSEIDKLVEQLKHADTYEVFKTAFDKADEVLSHAESMYSLMHVRHTIDTTDAFYDAENTFWDEHIPILMGISSKISKIVLDSPFRSELEKDVPMTYFWKAENALKSYDEKVVGDLQEENRLVSEYEKLIAKAQIEFEGETYTLASLGGKMDDPDVATREGAHKAYWGYMEEHESEIDDIYDRLVKVRTKIAKELGFNNFIELGYVRMNRFDYNADDVATYRKQILSDVVPVATRLYDAQKKRLGVDTLAVYNNGYEFTTGNPTPKYDKDQMVKIAQNMYHELSEPTGEFFDYMVNNELLDLVAKPGKRGGGYCTFISDYASPFIFSNFNGTAGDVDVLTHEAGHAFQVYSSRNIKPSDCIWPTYESAEIHSMSMEFFAWPWMPKFFEEDVEKYYYTHLGGAIKFLPYGITVDHFQHEVYANPEMTPAERKTTWRKLEKQYLPHKDYSDIPFLDKGTWWFRQAHIFSDPFYYVDYTLAQVVALQFWLRLQNKDANAFADYYEICKLGGTLPFRQIVAKANLKDPFSEGCLADVMDKISQYYDTIDDTKL